MQAYHSPPVPLKPTLHLFIYSKLHNFESHTFSTSSSAAQFRQTGKIIFASPHDYVTGRQKGTVPTFEELPHPKIVLLEAI
jgi:hypothetical protein